MKKLLFMAFAIVVSCIIGSCTAETEEETTARKAKAQDAKLKIMEMAKDYGLNVRIDEDFLNEYADQIDLDKVDEQFKALASIKGTYRLEKPADNGVFIQTKQIRKTERAKKEYRYTYEFEKVSVSGLHHTEYICECNVEWFVDSVTKQMTYANAEGLISCDADKSGSSYSELTASPDNKNNMITIGGHVDFSTKLSTIKPTIYDKGVIVRFDVTGNIGKENAIIWDCDEYAYPNNPNL